jgi:hypothetical protein
MAWNWSLVLMFQYIKDDSGRSSIPNDAVRNLQQEKAWNKRFALNKLLLQCRLRRELRPV